MSNDLGSLSQVPASSKNKDMTVWGVIGKLSSFANTVKNTFTLRCIQQDGNKQDSHNKRVRRESITESLLPYDRANDAQPKPVPWTCQLVPNKVGIKVISGQANVDQADSKMITSRIVSAIAADNMKGADIGFKQLVAICKSEKEAIRSVQKAVELLEEELPEYEQKAKKACKLIADTINCCDVRDEAVAERKESLLSYIVTLNGAIDKLNVVRCGRDWLAEKDDSTKTVVGSEDTTKGLLESQRGFVAAKYRALEEIGYLLEYAGLGKEEPESKKVAEDLAKAGRVFKTLCQPT